ncbi:YeiH family protein [Halalkalicoccus sp. NIPERK01]|uniref:YeiH family protein n=1 Tax=Halalkalicoccus sp. NIPERK01 TaxID=3053469 RepID=UPI00256F0F31|nr:putative sulfate exporter family transporter [Halalkalicoccus sp. NIPERK01]MDL5363839.1 putative sulfate exporter family transporter [Halalkalicoccus sp. NIPERK01]
MVIASFKQYIPGLFILLTIGIAGRFIADKIPGLNYLILSILIGLIIGNTIGTPDWAQHGTETHKLWLESGIVLMGASIAFDQVVEAGLRILLFIVLISSLTIIVLELLTRTFFNISEEVGSLLAAGSSICGVSAIVAVAGAIRARQDQIAYAAATVLIFDALTIFAYPLLGRVLGLSDVAFGIWAGTTMFSTGPVAAAGFAFSDTAGQWAVLVKLSRNALIGGAVIMYSFYYMQRNQSQSFRDALSIRSLKSTFPKFVIGFFGMMIVANSGILSDEQILSFENISNWMFLLAFAGLGLEIRIKTLRNTGLKPILLVFFSLVIVSTTSLMLITVLFGV